MTLFKRLNTKKTILGLLIIVVSIVLILIATSNSLKAAKYNYNDILINDNELQEITANKEKKMLSISSIKFDDNELFFDDKNNSYYYSLIENSNSAFNPKIKFISDNLEIKILNGKITDKKIEDNNTATIIIYNEESYNTFNLKYTTLPIMNIVYNENKDLNEKTKMELYLFDNGKDSKKRVMQSSGTVKYRGATTKSFPKKSLKISLKTLSTGNHKRNNNISILGLDKSYEYILYAGYNDQEKIRNVFTSNLWYESCGTNNSFNIKNGNYYKYIEVFLNNEYYGLYAIAVPINDSVMKIKDREYIYKKIDWFASEDYAINEGFINFPGYEIKNDNYIEHGDYKGFNDLNNYYYNLNNSNNLNELYNMVDIDNMVDYYLFTMVIQGADNPNGNNIKNVYITSKIKGNKKIMLYTPWDMDISFGNLWSEYSKNTTIPYGNNIETNNMFTLNPIGKLQLLNDENINRLIKERYADLRSNKWSDEYISNMINKYENNIYLSGAYKREIDRWPDGSYYDESVKLDDFKKYVLGRFYYTDLYINNLS